MNYKWFEKYYKDWHKLPEFQKKMIKILASKKKFTIFMPRKMGRSYSRALFKKYFEGKF